VGISLPLTSTTFVLLVHPGDQRRSADDMSQQPGSPSSSDNGTPDNYREAFQVSGYLQVDVSTNKPFVQRVGKSTRSSQSEFFSATSMSQKNISSSLISPCEQASKAAMACLDENNYNHAKCKDFFQTYRDCKKTWVGHLVSFCFTWTHLHSVATDKSTKRGPKKGYRLNDKIGVHVILASQMKGTMEYLWRSSVGLLRFAWPESSRTQRLINNMHHANDLLILPSSSHDLHANWNVGHIICIICWVFPLEHFSLE
jgi:hypothetical protein